MTTWKPFCSDIMAPWVSINYTPYCNHGRIKDIDAHIMGHWFQPTVLEGLTDGPLATKQVHHGVHSLPRVGKDLGRNGQQNVLSPKLYGLFLVNSHDGTLPPWKSNIEKWGYIWTWSNELLDCGSTPTTHLSIGAERSCCMISRSRYGSWQGGTFGSAGTSPSCLGTGCSQWAILDIARLNNFVGE